MIAGSFGPYLAQSTHDHEMGTEADLEPSISVVLWGRAEQFVAVPRGGAGESGGVDRRGVREPPLARGFAGRRLRSPRIRPAW